MGSADFLQPLMQVCSRCLSLYYRYLSQHTTDCCFSDLGWTLTMEYCEVMMVRLPDDGPFWKYGFQLFVGLSSYKNNSSSSASQKNESRHFHSCPPGKIISQILISTLRQGKPTHPPGSIFPKVCAN